MKRLIIKPVFTTLFKDKDGKIVIAQFPNAPLLLWLAAVVIGKFVSNPMAQTVISATGTIALTVWAVLEIYSGVNLFRKILGATVLAYIVISRLI